MQADIRLLVCCKNRNEATYVGKNFNEILHASIACSEAPIRIAVINPEHTCGVGLHVHAGVDAFKISMRFYRWLLL